MEFQRILVRATNWVGDAVMSLPALHALRERFPSAHIAILARPWVAGLYGREPFCDELIPYQEANGWRGWTGKWSAAADLRDRKFDCAILLQNAFEAAAIAWLARVPVRIGYDRDGRGPLLTDRVPVPKAGEIPKHQRFYYLELLKRTGLVDGYSLDVCSRLSGAKAAAEEGRKLFLAAQVREPVIGVSPGAAYGGAKRWLPERFANSAVQVALNRAASVAVFGSAQERAICDLVQKDVEASGIRCVNFAGETSLAEFIEMAAACQVYITNDSGPMHIASALGVPTVAIFGATDHEATGPTGDSAIVIRHSVPCSPCLLRECPIDHPCMTGVQAGRVAAAALSLLK